MADDIFLPNFLLHKAVHWPREGTDGQGMPVYGAVEEIDCRWDFIQEQFVMPGNEVVISNAIILVDRDMRVGDQLRYGTLDSVPNPNDPEDELNGETYEIRKWEKSASPGDPDLWVRIATV